MSIWPAEVAQWQESSISKAFSIYRLSGEVIPADVAILLEHTDELAERTGRGWSSKQKALGYRVAVSFSRTKLAA